MQLLSAGSGRNQIAIVVRQRERCLVDVLVAVLQIADPARRRDVAIDLHRIERARGLAPQ